MDLGVTKNGDLVKALEGVLPSIRGSMSLGFEATVGSRGQGRRNESLVHANLGMTSPPPPPSHGVVSTTPSGPPRAGRRLSGALETTADRAGEAAAPAARTPAPDVPAKSLTAGLDVGYRALPASGGQSPEERETRFLGSQMLVLPDGEHNVWDDILHEVLEKAPPAYSFRPRLAPVQTAIASRSSRAAQSHVSDGFSKPRPRLPPVATNIENMMTKLIDQMVSLSLGAEKNRENRRQITARRLSRGRSFGIRRSKKRNATDPTAGEAGKAGEAAAAEATAPGASLAAARAAADAAIDEARASRRHSAKARNRSGAAAGAEPGASEMLPGSEDLYNEGDDVVGRTPPSIFGQTELHAPETDPSGASEEGYDARSDRGPSSSASSLRGKQEDLVDGWPGGSDAATVDGRLGFTRSVPGLAELKQPLETLFETPVGSPGSSVDSEEEYESLHAGLDEVHLGEYFGHFRRNEIRLESLEHLTEEDLMEIGLPVGARKTFLVEVHGIPSARKEPCPPFLVHPSSSGVAPMDNSSQCRREVVEREDQQSQASSRSSGADYSSHRGEERFSPRARAGNLTGAGIPAPARGIPSRLITGVPASSLRARLKQQQKQKLGQGVTDRMSPPIERMARGNGGGASGTGRDVFGIGQVDYTRDSGVGLSRRDIAGTRPRSAVSKLAEPSPSLGGRGREQRASVGATGAKIRLAKAAAAEGALNLTAAMVSQLPTWTSSIPTRTYSTPRREFGASRLQTPTVRSTGIGGVPAPRATSGVLRGTVDSAPSPRAPAAATANTTQGTAPSLIFGGRGREQRASVEASGAKIRLAQAAATETALNATEATVSPLPTRTSSIPTRTSKIPTRTSSIPTRTSKIPTRTSSIPTQTSSIPTRTYSIPRREFGASRLQTPTVRSGRATGIGGVPAPRATSGVLGGGVDSAPSPRVAAAATAFTSQGTAGGLGIEIVAARRSFVPRPSSKERRFSILRKAHRA